MAHGGLNLFDNQIVNSLCCSNYDSIVFSKLVSIEARAVKSTWFENKIAKVF